jgi:hypothetical protein
MIYNKNIPTDVLEKTIRESFSWREAMKKLNKPTKGASYQYFQIRIKKLGIDTSHFLGKAAHSGVRHTGSCKKKPWNKILINNNIKERIHSDQLRRAYNEYCVDSNKKQNCVLCGNDGHWMGEKMILHIDHIDENRGNNTPENLQFLCANCHMIKTYKK